MNVPDLNGTTAEMVENDLFRIDGFVREVAAVLSGMDFSNGDSDESIEFYRKVRTIAEAVRKTEERFA